MENSCTSYLSATQIHKHPKRSHAIQRSPQKKTLNSQEQRLDEGSSEIGTL